MKSCQIAQSELRSCYLF